MRNLTTELGNSPGTATVIYEDDQSAISMTKNAQYHGKVKHIAIKYHFILEQVSDATVELQYCPTGEMVEDVFTKSLSRERFVSFETWLELSNSLISIFKSEEC